jgi:argininosuccinate lyase
MRYHKAYVLMLVEQHILAPDASAKLLGALRTVEELGLEGIQLDPALEDIHPNVERELIRRVGYAVGGNINLGRSRGEIVFISEHLALREEFLECLEANLRLRRTFAELAHAHLSSVMPYYTWIQQAEPITLGYYLASYIEEMEHHHHRLSEAYRELNVSLAGVGQIVPPSFPIDRRRLAQLLGFDDFARHSLYGYYAVDSQISALSALALMAATLSRLTLDFLLWMSNEFDLITFGDEFCQTSFIMPQKKNPHWIIPIRPAAMRIKSLYDLALDEFLHTTPMELGSIIEVPLHLHEAVGRLVRITSLTDAAMHTLEFNRARGAQLAEEHYAQSVQIMSGLVASGQVSWREAHLVMGHLIRGAMASQLKPSQLTTELLEKAALEVIGRPVLMTSQDLASFVDPLEIVKTRQVGGPAPGSVREALIEHEQAAARDEESLRHERDRLAGTWQSLDALARSMSGAGA